MCFVFENSVNPKLVMEFSELKPNYLEFIQEEELNDYVKIKLLNKNKLTLSRTQPKGWCCDSNQTEASKETILVHIHGGGFVAGSSDSNESYLRNWANNLNLPIISIDYRLAPKYPYPKALDDAWQAFNWILKNAYEEFSIQAKKIILCGDSAGGNLILGLVYLLIIHKVQLPEAVFLFYPACRINDNIFYPSHLISLQEELPIHLFEVTARAYKGDYIDQTDPFIDPQSMKDSILTMMPPMKIYVGSGDSIRDDAISYANRLIKLGKDCTVTEFKFFPHAFLSYDSPLLFPESRRAIDYIERELDEYVSVIK